jgi:hypothetical protein
MNDDLMYFPTTNLIDGCCNGDIDVHQPLNVENRMGDKRIEMIFIDHLLNNSNRDNVPYIKLLSDLRSSIRNNTNKLIDDNSFVKHLVDKSIKEWREDVSPYEIFHSDIDDIPEIDENYLFDYTKLKTEKDDIKDVNNNIANLEKILKKKRQNSENNILHYSDDIDNEIRELYTRSIKSKNRVKGHLDTLTKIRENIDPKYMKILLDLGMKNKSSYMQFFKDSSDSPITFYLNDKNSIGIPKNIQTVFTNYILINNMIHKELEYIQYRMSEINRQVVENNEILKNFVSGLNSIEHINDMNTSYINDDEGEGEVEEEDENEIIKKYVIREDKDENARKDTEDHSLLHRLSSYFTGEEEQRLANKDKEEVSSLLLEKQIENLPKNKINNEYTLFADAGDDY